MNQQEFNPFDKIRERDGLLIRQLYELMPEDKRPSYGHFRRVIQKERTKEGILQFRPLETSAALFLTKDRDIKKYSARKATLMMLIAEWEIYHKEQAFWYKPTSELWRVYEIFFRFMPDEATIKDAIERENLILFKYDVAFNRDWMKLVMNLKVDRFEGLRKKRLHEKGSNNLEENEAKKVNPDLRYYKIVEDTIEIKLAVKDNKGEIIMPAITKKVKKGVLEKPYMVMGKKIIKDKPLDITIYGLYSRGIMLRFKSSDKKNIDSLDWYWFDFQKRITLERFEDGVRAIFDFILFNDYQKKPFSITIYTWDKRSANNYKKQFIITEHLLSLNEPGKRKGSRAKMLKPDEVRFKGLEIISLDVDKYFNQVRKPGRKAPLAVQQAYGLDRKSVV